MSDPILRKNQMKQAYEGEGGIREVFEKIRRTYFERAGTIDPLLPVDARTAALENLARASRTVDMVEEHIWAIIDSGKIAEHEK